MSHQNTQLRLLNEWGPCPPDGYRYVDPIDGYISHAWTYVDWVNIAKGHFQANNRSIPDDLEALMQNQLCQTLPPGWCMYDDPNRPRPSTSLSWDDVASGVKTFSRWIAKGCRYVTKEEADRRALICSRCYLNVNVQGCTGCQKAVVEVTGNRKSKHDDSLRSCAVCRCFLRAKVHFRLEDLVESKEHKDLYLQVPHCWLNPGSENYHGEANSDVSH